VVGTDDGEQKVARELKNAQYLLTMGGPFFPKVLETAKQLKLIQALGQGTDRLPVKWALEKGITVANAGGVNAIAVAEHTILLILACLRNFTAFNQATRGGKFRSNISNETTSQFYDKTVGIVGFGNIGRRVAKLCYGFGANIIYYERIFVPYALRADLKARSVNLDELISTSDIVTLHVPALESTKGIIGWDQLTKMKSSAYIINTSRGANIDEKALIRALNEKRIAGAGLDVWDPEPPNQNNPLLQMTNVVATPHIAFATSTAESRHLIYEAMWRNILLVSEGKEPLNRVLEF
jgi:phosphoglycerate dehydrogenase-like enzyme